MFIALDKGKADLANPRKSLKLLQFAAGEELTNIGKDDTILLINKYAFKRSREVGKAANVA